MKGYVVINGERIGEVDLKFGRHGLCLTNHY